MFGKLGQLAGSALSHDAEPKIRQFLAENWPAISAAIKQQLGTAAADALRNDALVGQAGRIAYGFVPGVVRLAVSEEAFIGYINANRAKVLEWVGGAAKQG